MNTESYKELGDKNRGFLAGKYFTVLNGPIFDGNNQSHHNHANFSS